MNQTVAERPRRLHRRGRRPRPGPEETSVNLPRGLRLFSLMAFIFDSKRNRELDVQHARMRRGDGLGVLHIEIEPTAVVAQPQRSATQRVACCFSHFLVEPPWELAGLFRRRIAWDDGAIREPVGAVAVAFPMSRCCRSGEDVGAKAASVGKGRASAQHLSMPCPHAPQDAARSEGRVHIVTAGVVGGTAVVSASLGTREELARAGDTTPPGHARCSFATRRGCGPT